jgi:hypothetical protein
VAGETKPSALVIDLRYMRFIWVVSISLVVLFSILIAYIMSVVQRGRRLLVLTKEYVFCCRWSLVYQLAVIVGEVTAVCHYALVGILNVFIQSSFPLSGVESGVDGALMTVCG